MTFDPRLVYAKNQAGDYVGLCLWKNQWVKADTIQKINAAYGKFSVDVSHMTFYVGADQAVKSRAYDIKSFLDKHTMPVSYDLIKDWFFPNNRVVKGDKYDPALCGWVMLDPDEVE